jgi:hypothetical protein
MSGREQLSSRTTNDGTVNIDRLSFNPLTPKKDRVQKEKGKRLLAWIGGKQQRASAKEMPAMSNWPPRLL